MNSNKHILTMAAFLCIISSFSIAHAETSFFEKIESIKKDLYKTSTEELCTILEISPEPLPTITADQLKNTMDSASNIMVINVLPQKYHDDCHIKGSTNVPLPELVERTNSWNRAQKIVFYCALESCDAGEKACILLHCMGFTNVIDYKGGIKEWYQLNYPTEGPALSEYLHTRLILPALDEYKLYPTTIVCSRQTRWINQYQNS